MNHFATPFGLPDTAPELARRFAVIMAGLAALIARRFIRMPHLAPFTLLLWGRLNRAVRRLYRALTEPMKAWRRPAACAADARARPLALPAGRGWLVRELGWEAAGYMAQLEALLDEVATRSTLAQSPRAGRILRPICRMLGVSPAVTPAMGAAPATGAQPDRPVDGAAGARAGVAGICAVIETSP